MDVTWIQERFALAKERLEQWAQYETTKRPEFLWIREEAERLLFCATVCDRVTQGTYFVASGAEDSDQLLMRLAKDNHRFFEKLTETGFDTFWGNPVYAQNMLPEEGADVLSGLSRELSGAFTEAILGRTEALTCLMELFLEVCVVLQETPDYASVFQITKDYVQDYALEQTVFRCEQLLGMQDMPGTVTLIELQEHWQDLTYLYRFGLPLEEEKRKQVYALAMENRENRYQESFQVLQECSGQRIGLNGPIYKLPFLVTALYEMDLTSDLYQMLQSKLRIVVAPNSTVSYYLGGGGVYGSVDKRYVRLRQNDVSTYLDARTKKQMEKQVKTEEQRFGMTLEDLDLLKL